MQPSLKRLKPFDANLNSRNAANLVFDGRYKIKGYNGSKVRWSAALPKACSILLPPGECSLVFDFKMKIHIALYPDKYEKLNQTAGNTIEAGKTYFLKTFYNDFYRDKISDSPSYIVEVNDEKVNYRKEYSLFLRQASWHIKRLGTNITQDNAPQFLTGILQRIKNEGYIFVDDRGANAIALHEGFKRFLVSVAAGEILTYVEGNMMLLISGSELGILMSFRK